MSVLLSKDGIESKSLTASCTSPYPGAMLEGDDAATYACFCLFALAMPHMLVCWFQNVQQMDFVHASRAGISMDSNN